jgi:dTDP-4-dehydrorhamnose reductase|tara:strand:+ start:382 stop:1098 length:717 start_codon:yes stop_codon:yes gene_type:complete
MKKKILVTGGTGRFGSILKKLKNNHKMFFPGKTTLDITNFKSIQKYIKLKRPNIVIHLAGLSRPMNIHDRQIQKSIDLNIIGTSNITKACAEKNVKLVYFSTNYVYPGTKGNYKESDSLLPFNNYAWSKLGGECAVQMYKNSLILRMCMTEKPFTHKAALYDAKNSFMYHDEIAEILLKLINAKGILNVGGKSQSVYNFAKIDNPNIKKIFLKNNKKIHIPMNSSINIERLKKILKSK